MYNKKIYDINMLDRENSVVFYDSCIGGFNAGFLESVHNARVLNPEITQENVVIWGSGITGKRVFEILSEQGIKIECFIDSNRDLEGTYKCGLPVYTPEYIEKLPRKLTIIEAMEKWEEIDLFLRGRYENRFYFSFVENNEKEPNIGHYIKNMFNLKTWFGDFAFFIGKRIYVYGMGNVESQLPKYLKLLDICFGGFLIDESDDMEGNDIHGIYDVKYVEEVLNEKNYFVWVYDKKRVRRLDELGLIGHKNYICFQGGNYETANRKQIMDVNLGNNYLADSKYPGITVYGDDKEEDFRIAVLGNSTTDGKLFSFKSWPELMYDELHNKGLEHITIYNGGVVAYVSGQELLKLIRDVIPLKPDMIIVYDGFCDMLWRSPNLLINGYLKKILEFANENMENDEVDGLFYEKNGSVYYGIETNQDMFEKWLSNMRTMHAIASDRNIRFYSFCQPILSSKKGKTENEKNMLLSVESLVINHLINESFRKRINRMPALPVYIQDLSHIFDDEKDVYMDYCHVWEKGNQIIAREISRIILPEITCHD